MPKIIEIKSCWQCGLFNNRFYICNHEHSPKDQSELTDDNIGKNNFPSWCPLPDSKPIKGGK